MSLKVTCTRCGKEVAHECNETLVDAIKKLMHFKLECIPPGFKSRSRGYMKGAENHPFFSESFLYVLLGKEDARTVLGHIDSVIRAAGFDPNDDHFWED